MMAVFSFSHSHRHVHSRYMNLSKQATVKPHNISISLLVKRVLHFMLKDQYGPRTFFLEFPFFAKNMIIKSILNLWWHSKILKLFLGVVRGIFTKRLKRTRRLLYTVKYEFF